MSVRLSLPTCFGRELDGTAAGLTAQWLTVSVQTLSHGPPGGPCAVETSRSPEEVGNVDESISGSPGSWSQFDPRMTSHCKGLTMKSQSRYASRYPAFDAGPIAISVAHERSGTCIFGGTVTLGSLDIAVGSELCLEVDASTKAPSS